MLSLFLILGFVLFLVSCKSDEGPSPYVDFSMKPGDLQYNYYTDFFVCSGAVSCSTNTTAKLCRMYITIKDVNSNQLSINSAFLDPPDIIAPGRSALFAVRFDDPQKNIWNKMDKLKTIWEVKYEK